MGRLIETLSTFLEKRVKSAFWPYFLLSFAFYNKKIIYVTFFVSEHYLYLQNNCTRLEYAIDNFQFSSLFCTIGYALIAVIVGSLLTVIASWIQKGFEWLQYCGTNRIEKHLRKEIKEHLEFKKEYQDVFRTRAEDAVTELTNSREKELTRRIHDEFEQMRKEIELSLRNNKAAAYRATIQSNVHWLTTRSIADQYAENPATIEGRFVKQLIDEIRLLRRVDGHLSYTTLGEDVKNAIHNGKGTT